MFFGWFDRRNDRPMVSGELSFHGFGLAGKGGLVRFEIDTGAEMTVLGPQDVLRLGLDHRYFQAGPRLGGLTGSTDTYTAPATLTLGRIGDGAEFGYDLFNLTVLTYELTDGYVPSLLGRDVLNRLRMVYDPAGEGLLFEMRSCDFEVGP